MITIDHAPNECYRAATDIYRQGSTTTPPSENIVRSIDGFNKWKQRHTCLFECVSDCPVSRHFLSLLQGIANARSRFPQI